MSKLKKALLTLALDGRITIRKYHATKHKELVDGDVNTMNIKIDRHHVDEMLKLQSGYAKLQLMLSVLWDDNKDAKKNVKAKRKFEMLPIGQTKIKCCCMGCTKGIKRVRTLADLIDRSVAVYQWESEDGETLQVCDNHHQLIMEDATLLPKFLNEQKEIAKQERKVEDAKSTTVKRLGTKRKTPEKKVDG